MNGRNKQAAPLLKIRIQILDLLGVDVLELDNGLLGSRKPVQYIVLFVEKGGVFGCKTGVAFGLIGKIRILSGKRRFQLGRPLLCCRKIRLQPGDPAALIGKGFLLLLDCLLITGPLLLPGFGTGYAVVFELFMRGGFLCKPLRYLCGFCRRQVVFGSKLAYFASELFNSGIGCREGLRKFLIFIFRGGYLGLNFTPGKQPFCNAAAGELSALLFSTIGCPALCRSSSDRKINVRVYPMFRIFQKRPCVPLPF